MNNYKIEFNDGELKVTLGKGVKLSVETEGVETAPVAQAPAQSLLKKAASSAKSQPKKGQFSKEEDGFVISNYSSMGAFDISERLGRSEESIRNRLAVLRKDGRVSPKKKVKGRFEWTDEALDLLKSEYGISTVKQIAEAIGIAPASVYSKVYELRAAGTPLIDRSKEVASSDAVV